MEWGTAGQAPGRRFRLVLAEDHDQVREEVCRLLEAEFQVVCAVADGATLVEAAARLKPDAVVTDVRMPRLNGLEAGGQILGRGISQALVALSSYTGGDLVQAALEVGFRGYVGKSDAAEELIPAVYAALRGERYLSREVRGR